jgi:hypothetical protein
MLTRWEAIRSARDIEDLNISAGTSKIPAAIICAVQQKKGFDCFHASTP